MSEQILSDLSVYSKEDLSPEALRLYFNSSSESELLIYYQIKDGKLYFKRNWSDSTSYDRFKKTTKFLQKLVKKHSFPDMEWILTVHDGLTQKEVSRLTPCFCYAKIKERDGILFPDPLTEDFARVGRRSIWRSSFKPKYHWRNKKEVAFWRGATTGEITRGKVAYSETSWYQQPRTQLSLLTSYYPNQVDAGFTAFPGVEPKVLHDMHQHLKPTNWTRHKDHLFYKYLVVPDGNTCTYPRYYLALFSNSVVFKQSSNHIQWFYRALKPGQHFVEVAHDFSDLPEKVNWAKAHDKDMKQVARSSTAFIRQNMMPPHIEAFTKELLMQYAKKQNSQAPLFEGMMDHIESKGL